MAYIQSNSVQFSIIIILFILQLIFVLLNNKKRKHLLSYISIISVIIILSIFTLIYQFLTEGFITNSLYSILAQYLLIISISGVVPLIIASVYLKKLN